MEMRPTNAAAINKPRHIAGIDPKAVPVAFFTTAVCMFTDHNILGVASFVVVCAVGVWLAKYDSQMYSILLRALRQKRIYDPAKRRYFRLESMPRSEREI